MLSRVGPGCRRGVLKEATPEYLYVTLNFRRRLKNDLVELDSRREAAVQLIVVNTGTGQILVDGGDHPFEEAGRSGAIDSSMLGDRARATICAHVKL